VQGVPHTEPLFLCPNPNDNAGKPDDNPDDNPNVRIIVQVVAVQGVPHTESLFLCPNPDAGGVGRRTMSEASDQRAEMKQTE